MEMTSIEEDEERERLAGELWAALGAADVARVRVLLAKGCDPDVWGWEHANRAGDLPLQAAANIGGAAGLKIVKALVEAGADLDSQGGLDETALHRAVYDDRKDGWATARFLVKAGASCGAWDKNGLTPPEAAKNEGNVDAVLAMLDAGMSPWVCGKAGSLLWYVAWDAPDLVEELLARGCHPDHTNRGQTPLARAVEAYVYSGKRCPRAARSMRVLVQDGANRSKTEVSPEVLEEMLIEAATGLGRKGPDWKDRGV